MSVEGRVFRGILSGLAGTIVLTLFRRSLSRLGVVDKTAPEQVVERLEETGLLDNWSPAARQALTLFAHLGYGMGAGAVFGMLRREPGSLETEASVGAALGVLVWGAGWSGWLPILGVHRAPWEQRTPKVLLPVVDHAVFGTAWGLIYRVLTRR